MSEEWVCLKSEYVSKSSFSYSGVCLNSKFAFDYNLTTSLS